MKLHVCFGIFLIAAVLALSLSGCGGGERGLRVRAVGYYNYLTGAGKMTKEDFISPAARKTMNDEQYRALKLAQQELEKARQELRQGSRFTPKDVKIDEIAAKVDGKFGVTSVPYVYEPASLIAQVKWVRVGGRWYIYAGSPAEVDAYGQFPSGLVIDVPRPGQDGSNASSGGNPR